MLVRTKDSMTSTVNTHPEHDPQEAAHDALLAEAFRHNAPQPPREGSGEPTTGSLDLEARNALRRVGQRTEIRTDEAEEAYEVEYRKLRLEQVILVGASWRL